MAGHSHRWQSSTASTPRELPTGELTQGWKASKGCWLGNQRGWLVGCCVSGETGRLVAINTTLLRLSSISALGMEPRASLLSGKCSTTELSPQPLCPFCCWDFCCLFCKIKLDPTVLKAPSSCSKAPGSKGAREGMDAGC